MTGHSRPGRLVHGLEGDSRIPGPCRGTAPAWGVPRQGPRPPRPAGQQQSPSTEVQRRTLMASFLVITRVSVRLSLPLPVTPASCESLTSLLVLPSAAGSAGTRRAAEPRTRFSDLAFNYLRGSAVLLCLAGRSVTASLTPRPQTRECPNGGRTRGPARQQGPPLTAAPVGAWAGPRAEAPRPRDPLCAPAGFALTQEN